MRCQHIDSGKQCEQEATRDIRIATARQRWRLWLCEKHVREEIDLLVLHIDKMAVEQTRQKQS